MEEEVVRRQMPHNLEAERSVIGALIMDKDMVGPVSEIITKDDFYHQQYGIMFESIVELFNSQQPIDDVTLSNKLREKDVSPEIASIENLSELVASVPLSVNAPHYANIVKEKSLLRLIIKTNQEIENSCYNAEENVEQILDDTEKKIFSLIQNRSAAEFEPIEKIVMRAVNKIASAAKLHGTVTGIPTGFRDLDNQTAGLQPSDLILIAARPSMGKTAFVLNIADYVTCQKHMAAAVFSLEMSKEQLVNRLLSQESRVDAQKLRTGQLQEADWEKLVEGANIVGASDLIIDDTPGISIGQLRSKCRKYKLEKDIKIIFIDYLQLMTGGGKSESRQQEISEISRSLKALARELNVPVVALSQLSRAVEQRPDHRPMMSDLRESGAIEQDADVIMFIYRDDYYNKDTENKNVSEIIVAKQRNGPIGTIELAWLPEFTRFANKEHYQ